MPLHTQQLAYVTGLHQFMDQDARLRPGPTLTAGGFSPFPPLGPISPAVVVIHSEPFCGLLAAFRHLLFILKSELVFRPIAVYHCGEDAVQDDQHRGESGNGPDCAQELVDPMPPFGDGAETSPDEQRRANGEDGQEETHEQDCQ